MYSTHSRFTTVAMGVLAMLYVTGCESGSQVPNEEVRFHTYDINAYPMNKVVCDPMGGGGGTTAKQGIKAELFSRSQSQARFYKAQDYVDFTTKADQTLFFSEMFVPTRMFDVGFTTQTSGVLKNDVGQTLIEYFGIKMHTSIQLAPTDSEGVYEFALLSDDGSVMKIKNGDSYSEIINNDGDHPTRMGCSSHRITMTKATKLETEILYYQGPRYHISNILLWRKLSDAEAAGADTACGVSGNDHWFNPNNNSQPTANFNALFTRGWNVVSQDNFYLPQESTENTQFNPCTEGSAPMISQLQIDELVSTDVFISWSTDIPATSQIIVTNVATGDSVLTATDNILRTRHSIRYSGLLPNTQYQVRVINVSEDLGKALGGPIDFTTP